MSVRMEQLGSCWTDFYEFWCLGTFQKSVEKIKVLLKAHMINGHFIWIPTYMYGVSPQFFFEWEIFQARIVEKIKTHTFFFENFFTHLAVYEITWKNMAEPDAPQMVVRRMPFACWLTKAADTHSEYEILIAFPKQHKRASLLHYTYFAWLLVS